MRTALLLTGRLEKVLCMGDAVQGEGAVQGGGGAMTGKGAVCVCGGGGGCCPQQKVTSQHFPSPLWTDRQV